MRVKIKADGITIYTQGFFSELGNNKASAQSLMDTTVGDSKVSVLNVDNDGDGKYDIRYKAGKNEYGKEKTEGERWFKNEKIL